jgi:carbon-monoxide dehydrogenase small subunit
MKKEITFRLNGTDMTVTVEAHWRLLDMLQRVLRLTGTKEGCGEGECGACTVIVDGRAVNACLYPVCEIEGKHVTTIEGLASCGTGLSRIQQAFIDHGAIQCGFCTPGMIMTAHALLEANPEPDDEEIRAAFIGNLCRCTGYAQIIEAVRAAARTARSCP